MQHGQCYRAALYENGSIQVLADKRRLVSAWRLEKNPSTPIVSECEDRTRIALTGSFLLGIAALAAQTPSATKAASWAAKTEGTVGGLEADLLVRTGDIKQSRIRLASGV
jgi:hypothetical protein